jgi:hypothetical protein
MGVAGLDLAAPALDVALPELSLKTLPAQIDARG